MWCPVIFPLDGTYPESFRLVQLAQTIEDFPSRLARPAVGVLVNVSPGRRCIGPNQEAETLQQPIAAGPARVCVSHIVVDARRLCVTQDGNAHRLDMTVPAPDPIESVRLRSRPPREIEPARYGLLLALEVLEQRNLFVALNKDTGRVADEYFAQAFVGRIVSAKPDRRRLFRLLANIEFNVLILPALALL